MGFTDDELESLFKETNRILKNNGLLSFFVRNDKDIVYRIGTKITENLNDINGFQIRFFTKEDIKYFINGNFKIQNIIEDYEESARL